MFAVGADAGQRIERLLSERLVESFLHELRVAKDGGEWRSKLMAHVGDELGLVLAGNLQLAAFLCDLVEQARVLQRNHRLIGEALHECDHPRRELAGLAPVKDERAEWSVGTAKRDDEGSA